MERSAETEKTLDPKELAKLQAAMRERHKGKTATLKPHQPRAVIALSAASVGRQTPSTGTTRRSATTTPGHPTVDDVLADHPQPLEPIVVSKETVYRVDCGPSVLSVDDRAELLLDRLMAVCFQKPEFLRPESIDRYLHLLVDLKNFVFVDFSPNGRGEVRVADIRIARLRLAMGEWIRSYSNDDCHPILASYAIDAAQFVRRMANGCYSFAEPPERERSFKIKGLLAQDEEWDQCHLDDFADARFKSEITRRSSLGRVICQVPGDASVLRSHRESVLASPGDEFVFTGRRCYLSSGVSDYIDARCMEPYRPDMQDDFKFYGEAETTYLDDEGEKHASQMQMEIPGHWIVAAIMRRHVSGTWCEEILPVPFRTPTKSDPPAPFLVM